MNKQEIILKLMLAFAGNEKPFGAYNQRDEIEKIADWILSFKPYKEES